MSSHRFLRAALPVLALPFVFGGALVASGQPAAPPTATTIVRFIGSKFSSCPPR